MTFRDLSVREAAVTAVRHVVIDAGEGTGRLGREEMGWRWTLKV